MERKQSLKYYISCIIVTVVMVCLSVYYYSGYQDYFVMPLYEYIYPQEVHFCLICTILMIVITAIWTAIFIAGAVKKEYKKIQSRPNYNLCFTCSIFNSVAYYDCRLSVQTQRAPRGRNT